MGTKVREVMTPRPHCATPDTPLSQVAEIMARDEVGAVPLVLDDRLVGLVTDRDIVVRALAAGKDARGMPAREVASGDVVAVSPEHDLSEALQLMARYKVRRLPVIEDGDRLVGIVAQADVALEAKGKASGEMLEEISKPEQGPRLS
jgi:CBS domain-containing protein